MAQNLPFYSLMAMVRKPFYATVGVFSSSHDLSWIPDSTLNFVFEEPAAAADGSRTEFVFDGTPKYVMLDGQWRRPDVGYALNGATVTFLDESGTVFAPRSGADIVALV